MLIRCTNVTVTVGLVLFARRISYTKIFQIWHFTIYSTIIHSNNNRTNIVVVQSSLLIFLFGTLAFSSDYTWYRCGLIFVKQQIYDLSMYMLNKPVTNKPLNLDLNRIFDDDVTLQIQCKYWPDLCRCWMLCFSMTFYFR